MHVDLAEMDMKYIKDSVKNGYFSSEAEAVKDAVRRAREQHEAKLERLSEALRRGDVDIAAGRVTTYTSDFIKNSQERARQMVREKRKPNPDVIP